MEAKELTDLTVTAGKHTVTIALDRRERRDGLRVELGDVKGSPARVRVIGGK